MPLPFAFLVMCLTLGAVGGATQASWIAVAFLYHQKRDSKTSPSRGRYGPEKTGCLIGLRDMAKARARSPPKDQGNVVPRPADDGVASRPTLRGTFMRTPKKPSDKPKPIADEVAEISASVPDEEWQEEPADGAANYEKELYGMPQALGPEGPNEDDLRQWAGRVIFGKKRGQAIPDLDDWTIVPTVLEWIAEQSLFEAPNVHFGVYMKTGEGDTQTFWYCDIFEGQDCVVNGDVYGKKVSGPKALVLAAWALVKTDWTERET